MATVYKAYQPSLARHVAIKVLPAFFAEDAGFRERFQQEAVAVAKLRHPNILQVFEYGEESGVTYIVSEFVDGGTLAEQLGTPLPVDYVVKVLTPVAAALDYAHARGVLHRDVKPSNVLLARDGTPILSDFGLAKMVGSLPRLTQTGTTVGTPEYMAPEQGSGETVGPASDQYALAVVAYEMLTGRVPFTAETPLAVVLAHMHKPLPLPRAVNPALSPAIEAALLKGLAKAPGDRYPDASALVRALGEAISAHAPVPAARPARSALPLPFPLPLAAVAVLAGALVLGGVVAFVAGRTAEPSTPTPAPTVAATPPASPGATAAAGGVTSATPTPAATVVPTVTAVVVSAPATAAPVAQPAPAATAPPTPIPTVAPTPAPTAAPTVATTGTVRGTVRWNTDPVAGIIVRLLRNGTPAATVPTNGLGQYVMTGLAPGRYDVEVESAPAEYDGGWDSPGSRQLAAGGDVTIEPLQILRLVDILEPVYQERVSSPVAASWDKVQAASEYLIEVYPVDDEDAGPVFEWRVPESSGTGASRSGDNVELTLEEPDGDYRIQIYAFSSSGLMIGYGDIEFTLR